MYYFHQPYHQHFLYGPTAYQVTPASSPFHSGLLYQPVEQPHSPPAQPHSMQQPKSRPSFPAVNPGNLYASAKESRKLMAEASILLDRLATSKEFDAKLMNAAQRSDTAEVNRLIRSIGLTSRVNAEYNPEGLRLGLTSEVAGVECCQLSIAMRWN